MSKRTIDLTSDEELSQPSSQRARELPSDEEDGMQVDVEPRFTHGAATTTTTTTSVYHRNARSLPGIMAPDHAPSFLANPIAPGSTVYFQEERYARPGFPEHMFDNVLVDEVVLTSILIFKFFADFPPELTELLCYWITKIAFVKQVLIGTSNFGRDHENPFFVIDPRFPEDLAVISANPPDYNNFRIPARGFRNSAHTTFHLLSLVCPFEKFIARVFVNILQLQRAEMTIRETERKWRLDLAKTFAQTFPGQKVLLTTEMPSVVGSHCKVALPSVTFHLSDTFGNAIRPFSFVALKLPAGIHHIFATAVSHPDFRCFNGLPPLAEFDTEGLIPQPTFFNLNNALRGEPDEKGKFSGLVPSRGLLLSTYAPTNSRLVFHVRNNDFSEEDDELIFKFVVRQKD